MTKTNKIVLSAFIIIVAALYSSQMTVGEREIKTYLKVIVTAVVLGIWAIKSPKKTETNIKKEDTKGPTKK